MYAPTSAKHLATEAAGASVTYLFLSSAHMQSDSPDKREHPWALGVQALRTRTHINHTPTPFANTVSAQTHSRADAHVHQHSRMQKLFLH